MKVNNTFGFVRALPEGDSRKVIFTASTSAKDRHGTVLNQKNWDLENFNRNGIIGYNHEVYGSFFGGSDPDDVIGRGTSYVKNGELLVEIDFEPEDINPKADKIFKKVKHGTLSAVSVGFSPLGEGRFGEGDESRGAANETYYFEGQELLEISIVNIPSNAEAVKKSLNRSALDYILKNFDNISTEDREVLKSKLNDNTNTEDDEELPAELQETINREVDRIQKEIIEKFKGNDFNESEYEYRKRKLNILNLKK